MKKFTYQVGIDVAKSNLDCTLLQEGQKLNYHRIINTPKGVKDYLGDLEKQGVKLSEVLFCMEYTGVYNAHVLHILIQKNCSIWLEVDATRLLYVLKDHSALLEGKMISGAPPG